VNDLAWVGGGGADFIADIGRIKMGVIKIRPYMIHHNAVYGQLFVIWICHDAINHIYGVIKINNANTINDVGAYFNTPFLSPRNLPYFATKSESIPYTQYPKPKRVNQHFYIWTLWKSMSRCEWFGMCWRRWGNVSFSIFNIYKVYVFLLRWLWTKKRLGIMLLA